ncbi:hypothetical protein DFH28DRAFT_911643, partial [Melampsora americana]
MAPDASDTGQIVEEDLTNESPSAWTDPNASSQSNDAVAAFLRSSDRGLPQVDLTTETLGLSRERTEVPHLAEFSRKRARACTPGLAAQDHVQSVTGTPRSERMARLVPGCEDDRSLTNLLAKLMEVTNASIQLPAKGRIAKNVSVNVDTAPDILVLVNAAYDQHQLDLYKKVLFKPAAVPTSSTRATAPLPNPSLRPSTSFDFQASAIADKLDVLTENLNLLISAQASAPNQQKTNKSQPGSYASAAAKTGSQGAQSHPSIHATGPRAPPKPQPRKRVANTVTLSQVDKSQVALASLSIVHLIQGFNGAFESH